MIYIWKDKIIDGLRGLADYNYQKKALLNPTGPVMWLFVEDYQDIFEDTGLLAALKANQLVFGKSADQALRDLEYAMHQIDSNLSDMVIVDLPEMQIVRQKAAKALKLIEQATV